MADSKKIRWGWTSASLIAIGMAMGLGGGVAAAQEADDEIVVTGFRGSLAQGIDIKRREVGAVDAIVAEDIADMPDQNLAESIQRIPGVAITREAGEGRQISVRGLSPDFTRIRINGMEAITTGGGTDATGGTNRGRAFDFNTFASDLFNSITVRKTASAATEEGSLGATVELRTARPFDYDGFVLALSGQGNYNSLSQETDPRFAFLLSNRWGNFGALFSVAWGSRDALEEGASTVRWNTTNEFAAGSPIVAPTIGAVNAAFHPRIPRYDIYEHYQERIGATLSFQWRPTQQTDINLDILYATFDAERAEIFLEVPSFSSSNNLVGSQGMCVTAAEIQGGNLMYGEFTNTCGAGTGTDIRSEARFDVLQTEFTQVTLSAAHEFTPTLRGTALVGYASSEHDNPIQTTILWDANNIPFFSYDYRQDNRLPIMNYGGTDVTAPATWALSQVRMRPQTATNTFTTAYGDLAWDVSDTITLRGGLNYRLFEFETTEMRRDPLTAGCGGTATSNAETCLATVPVVGVGTYAQLYQLSGRSLDIPGGNQNIWLGPNFSQATAQLQFNNPSLYGMSFLPALGNNRWVEEEALGFYVQADWDTDIAGMPFRGNIGVRYVETDQTAAGLAPILAAPFYGEIVASRSYSDTLPSLNMVIEPTDGFLIRFAAAEVMARPGLGNLNPAPAISVSGANRTITLGNPNLDPFRATAFDLSFEWYFAPESLVSVALFHKDINSLVSTARITIPNFAANPAGIDNTFGLFACGGVVAGCMDQTWQYNEAVNSPGGPVEGFEIGLQLPFTFLPGILGNFGFAGNYTRVTSDITYFGPTGLVIAEGDLTGLSRESYNATLYYDDGTFSARIMAAHRSRYLTTIPGRDGNLTEETAATTNIDMAAAYNFNEAMTLYFEGLNLTDEVNDQYLTPDDRSSFYHAFGRTFAVGFRYRY